MTTPLETAKSLEVTATHTADPAVETPTGTRPPAHLDEPQSADPLLRAVHDQLRSSRDKLEPLYAQNMEWARHFNGLIWTIASILLPISFAGFAVDFRDDQGVLDKEALTFVGGASSLLLLFWSLLSEWHRQLWKRAFVLTGLIEAVLGYRRLPNGFKKEELSRHMLAHLTPVDWGSWIRWFVVILGLLLWTTRILFAWSYQ